MVAAVYAIGGVETPRALLILELAQALLGGWLVAETIRLARSVAPGRTSVAIASGLVVAVHPTLVYAATHVQVAGLAAVLLVATLARAFGVRTVRGAFVVGLWLAALMLTDPILGLVAPAAWWAISRRADCRFKALGAMALAATIGISPWMIRNAVVHGEFVPIKSTFGYAFWQGNCRQSQGTDKVVRASVETALNRDATDLRQLNATLWAARHEAGYIDDIALTRADYQILGAVSEPERSRILFRRALSELKGQAGRYRSLCLRRLRYFVLFDETNPKTRNRLYRIGHAGLTGLALLGLILAPAEVRRRLGPTLLTVGLIATFHALTIVSARFHLPIEPLLAVWAARASGESQWSAIRPAKSRASGLTAGLAFVATSGSGLLDGSGRKKTIDATIVAPTIAETEMMQAMIQTSTHGVDSPVLANVRATIGTPSPSAVQKAACGQRDGRLGR